MERNRRIVLGRKHKAERVFTAIFASITLFYRIEPQNLVHLENINIKIIM